MLGYLRAFWEQFDYGLLLATLQQLAGVLLCLTVHETCHGLAALALGDPTAKQMRRLSFNPLRHIDPLGLLSMLVCGFGWAKPVPVDMRYFKNPRAGMALTALAGPVSNFLLAVALVFAGSLSLQRGAAGLASFLMVTAVLSIGLGLFNLLPIPPLDGSKVLFALLPERSYQLLMRYERFGVAALLLLVWLDVGGGFFSDSIYRIYLWMVSLFL